jgi:hypothetical protein
MVQIDLRFTVRDNLSKRRLLEIVADTLVGVSDEIYEVTTLSNDGFGRLYESESDARRRRSLRKESA